MTTAAVRSEEEPPDKQPEAVPKRINVSVTPDMVQALQRVMHCENVTLTEACRRLIGYGDFVYRAIKEENAEVLVKVGETTREFVLL